MTIIAHAISWKITRLISSNVGKRERVIADWLVDGIDLPESAQFLHLS